MAIALGVACARAQVVKDGATNTLSNVTNTFAGTVTVGTNGSFTLLILTNGTLLTNSGNGVIGRNAGANSNTAWLTGTNTRWLISSNLFVGSNGSFNRLVISNGALVGNSNGNIGYGAGSGSNEVVVTGTNSFWSNRSDLTVGVSGCGNRLLIDNGGMVQNSYGYLGYSSNSSYNMAVVTGAGSRWSNGSDLYVGNSGAGNQLVISNGGTVLNGTGWIGFNSTSSNNLAVVTGAGSLWSNGFDLNVGVNGAGNQLVISNGGTVQNRLGYLGYTSDSSNNVAVVTGAGSLWSNASGLNVGGNGAGNQLRVSDGGTVWSGAGVLGSASDNNVAVVTGASSLWSNGFGLVVGSFGAGNQLVVSNGGTVQNLTGTLGLNPSSSNNVTVVTDSGSLWSSSSNLFVGFQGAFNQLVVSNGGTVRDTDGYLGAQPTSSNNVAVVTGAGSLWSNAGSLYVGSNGAFNQLVVRNGGTVKTGGRLTLGYDIGSTNNSVLAVGGALSSVGLTLGNVASRNNSISLLSNSTWNAGGGSFIWGNVGMGDTLMIDATSALTNIGALALNENNTTFMLTNGPGGYSLNGFTTNQFQFSPSGLAYVSVGSSATNVQLLISNYTLASTDGDVGFQIGANSNRALITGTGALWSNVVYVGREGSFNQLIVSNGGVALNARGVIGTTVGDFSTARNNLILVSGSGSMWSNKAALTIGFQGAFNQLIVANGGVAFNGSVDVGYQSSSNLALVTGAGSFWSNSFFLNIGDFGSFNQLVISNGGAAASPAGTVGKYGTSTSNLALVTGSGSRWSNSINLTIGDAGSFNQLIVSNGGTVANTLASIGSQTNANRNSALITGNGSLWSNRGSLFVGSNGSLNQLLITNGGVVVTTNLAVLGVGSISFGNLVSVSGSGSQWQIGADLFIGSNGFGNRLAITDGGVVGNGVGQIGFTNSSSNNEVLVSGPGSVWSNRTGMFVGNSGSGNRLTITNGGLVWINGNADIGFSSNSRNNELLVASSGAMLTNAAFLNVGNSGSGSRMTISNGATVVDLTGRIGVASFSTNNEVVVTGAGSLWSNRADLSVGQSGSANRLTIGTGATVFVANNAYVGFTASAGSNLLQVSDGTLRVHNTTNTGVLDIRRGTNRLDSGLIDVDRLFMVGGAAHFEFNGGTLNVRTSTVANTLPFVVGNGASAATMNLVGDGAHSFANGLVISSNATLAGTGNITGAVTNFGTISAGNSAGSLRINGDLRLRESANLTFEIGGLIATNDYDQINVTNFVEFAGTLSLQLINSFVPVWTDAFTLMTFASNSGSFTNVADGVRLNTVGGTNSSFRVDYDTGTLRLSDYRLDTDSDGIDDGWANSYFGHSPLTPAEKNADADGDGQSNYAEYLAGTNPLDSARGLRVTSITTAPPGYLVLQFQSVLDRAYRIEYSDDLVTWAPAAGALFSYPSPGICQWIDDGTLTGGFPAAKRHYRVGLE